MHVMVIISKQAMNFTLVGKFALELVRLFKEMLVPSVQMTEFRNIFKTILTTDLHLTL